MLAQVGAKGALVAPPRAVGAVLRGRVHQLSCSISPTLLSGGMVYVRRRVWLLCASAAAASLLVLRPFQAAEEPAASSLPDVEALRNPCSSKMTRRAPEAFRACFGTSHGPFEAHCVRRRAPVWVDRVYNLLVNGFYDDQRGRMLSVPRPHERTSGIHVGRWQPLGSGPLSSRSRPDSCSHTSHSPSWLRRRREPRPLVTQPLTRPKSATSVVAHPTACTSVPGTSRACSMAAGSPSCSLAPPATAPPRTPHPP